MISQRQYIFIHDAVLELIRIGNTEVSIQSLRKTFKHLQEQNPHSETSGMEEEYLVSPSLPLSLSPSLPLILYLLYSCPPTYNSILSSSPLSPSFCFSPFPLPLAFSSSPETL